MGGRNKSDGYPFEISEVFFQTRVGYGSRTDGQVVYQGWAAGDAMESEPVWIIKKNFYASSSANAAFIGSTFAGGTTGTPTHGDSRPVWAWSDLLAGSLTFPAVTGGV